MSVPLMDFSWSAADLAFKEELEAFLDKELPPFVEQWPEIAHVTATNGAVSE